MESPEGFRNRCFDQHTLTDVVDVIRFLEKAPCLPSDLSFPGYRRGPVSWPEQFVGEFGRRFDWHECSKARFYPLREEADGRILGASPDDLDSINWPPIVSVLKKAGIGVDLSDVRKRVSIVLLPRFDAIQNLNRIIDLVDVFAQEGDRLLKGEAAAEARARMRHVDDPKMEAVRGLSEMAQCLGSTEACMEAFRALSRVSGDTRLFDRCALGLYSLALTVFPYLVPLLRVRGYLSYASASSEEERGLSLPGAREAVRRQCEDAKLELQAACHAVHEQLSGLIEHDGVYLLFGYSRLALKALVEIRQRKQFKLCIIENPNSEWNSVRREQCNSILERVVAQAPVWEFKNFEEFKRQASSITEGKRPKAVVCGARCCFAHGAICEKGLQKLMEFVNGEEVESVWPKGRTELFLVASLHKFFRGDVGREALRDRIDNDMKACHEFQDLRNADSIVL
jgi:hypothetical protein